MNRKLLALLGCLCLFLTIGCQPTNKIELRPLRIGSITFTEHILLAEMQKILIEHNLGYKVEHIPNFAASGVLHQSMLNGEIDLSARYLGTEMTGPLAMKTFPHDVTAALELVRREFANQFQQTVFDPFGFENTYAFAIRREQAKQFDIQTISGLAPYAPRFKIGTDTTWLERSADGYLDLAELYGFQFRETVPMEITLVYKALRDKQLDVAVAYSTDSRLKTYDLVLLRDDKQFFPPYNAVIIARNDALEKHPGLREELAKLSGLINNQTMIDLNYQVDELKRPAAQVARDFLTEQGVLKP